MNQIPSTLLAPPPPAKRGGSGPPGSPPDAPFSAVLEDHRARTATAEGHTRRDARPLRRDAERADRAERAARHDRAERTDRRPDGASSAPVAEAEAPVGTTDPNAPATPAFEDPVALAATPAALLGGAPGSTDAAAPVAATPTADVSPIAVPAAATTGQTGQPGQPIGPALVDPALPTTAPGTPGGGTPGPATPGTDGAAQPGVPSDRALFGSQSPAQPPTADSPAAATATAQQAPPAGSATRPEPSTVLGNAAPGSTGQDTSGGAAGGTPAATASTATAAATAADRAAQPAATTAAASTASAPSPQTAPTAAPAAPATPGLASALPTTTPARGVALEHAVETVRLALRAAADRSVAHARISLTPRELGGIDVHLRQTADGLVARVVAQHAAAADLLQQAGAELRRSLEAQGLTLLRLDIGASGEQGGRAAGDRAAGFANGADDGTDARRGAASRTGAIPTDADLDTGALDGANPADDITLLLPNGALVDVLA